MNLWARIHFADGQYGRGHYGWAYTTVSVRAAKPNCLALGYPDQLTVSRQSALSRATAIGRGG